MLGPLRILLYLEPTEPGERSSESRLEHPSDEKIYTGNMNCVVRCLRFCFALIGMFTLLCCFGWLIPPTVFLFLTFCLCVFLIVGGFRLVRSLVRQRASVWFSGMITAIFMIAAGSIYGLLAR